MIGCRVAPLLAMTILYYERAMLLSSIKGGLAESSPYIAKLRLDESSPYIAKLRFYESNPYITKLRV